MPISIEESFSLAGAATASATDVSVNGQAAEYRRIEYYWKQLAVNNGSGPVWQGVTNSVTLSNQTVTVTGRLLVPSAGQTFGYDADGNLSGEIDGAAGIGGLVEVSDHSSWPPGRHFTVFDGNGNIMGLVKSDATVSARYEYGPFGEPTYVQAGCSVLSCTRGSRVS